MAQQNFKVYKYFHVKKSYGEMLAENDYNPKIREFILDINAKMGTQWVVKELETIFEAAYWICGSLSHDFRKYDDYGTVIDSLPDHNCRYMAALTQFPEAMDTLHAIVYLILEHDVNFQRPADANEVFSRIDKKRRRLADALQKFSRKDKKKYHYDYSISIDRNWEDREIEEFINDYWEPDIAAEKIIAFASYFDKEFSRKRMVDKAFSAVCNLYKKWDGQRYLGYEPQEYIDKLRESLRSLYESRSSNNAVKQTRIREKNPLFDDEELQQRRASQFVDFLKQHHRYSGKVNCGKDDYINRAFVAFYRKWEWKDGEKPLPNGSACFRFLMNHCGLEDDDVTMKGYGDFIRKRIRDEKYDLKGVDLKVEDFLLNTPK